MVEYENEVLQAAKKMLGDFILFSAKKETIPAEEIEGLTEIISTFCTITDTLRKNTITYIGSLGKTE